MKRLPLLAIVAVLILKGAGAAAAAELPTYEVMGFPISPVQMSVLRPAHVQEVPRAPTATSGGMPASPHQSAKPVVGGLATKPTEGRAR